MSASPAAGVLSVSDLGPIGQAEIHFGDLTVLVGPQASGKSILLQLLKLQLDARHIASRLAQYGYDWDRDHAEAFLDLYFGEGLGALWSPKTQVTWNGRPSLLAELCAPPEVQVTAPQLFYIPAQRVVILQSGWPRPFDAYGSGDPYVVRGFSEYLRQLMEGSLARRGGAVFPSAELLPETRGLLTQHIFGRFALHQDIKAAQRRLVLQQAGQPPLPFMVWSAGQREFSPLLLGVYSCLPRERDRPRPLDWVVIEEPEMGLHPRAISAVLFLVLELLHRGYRICLSTHSPQVLDLLWALRVLIERGASPDWVLKLFDVPRSPATAALAASILGKVLKVYSFNRDAQPVTDISRLDPDSARPDELTWGGLTEFSAHTADVVADFIAQAPEPDPATDHVR